MAGASIDIGVVMHGFGAASESLGVMQQSLEKLEDVAELTSKTFKDLTSSVEDKAEATKKARQELLRTGATIATFSGKWLRGLSNGWIQAAGTMQQYQMMLKTVNKDTAAATAQFKRLEDAAKLPGMSLDGMVRGVAQLQAAGIAAETAESLVKGLGNALASVGGDASELSGLARAFTQIQAKGKVFAEEIQQIAERLPQVRVLMRDAFGTANTEAIQQMGLKASEFSTIMAKALGKLPPAADTAQNALKNLNEAVFLLSASLGKSLLPSFTSMVKALTSLVDGFNKTNGTVKFFIANLVSFTGVALSAAAIVGSLGLAFGQLKNIITLLAGTLGTVKKGMIAVTIAGKAMELSVPWIAAISAVALFVSWLLVAKKASDDAKKAAAEAAKTFKIIMPDKEQDENEKRRIQYGKQAEEVKARIGIDLQKGGLPALSSRRGTRGSRQTNLQIEEARLQATNELNQLISKRRLDVLDKIIALKDAGGNGNIDFFRDIWQYIWITDQDGTNGRVDWAKLEGTSGTKLLTFIKDYLRVVSGELTYEEFTAVGGSTGNTGKVTWNPTDPKGFSAIFKGSMANIADEATRLKQFAGMEQASKTRSQGFEFWFTSKDNFALQKEKIDAQATETQKLAEIGIQEEVGKKNFKSARDLASATLQGNALQTRLAEIDVSEARFLAQLAYSKEEAKTGIRPSAGTFSTLDAEGRAVYAANQQSINLAEENLARAQNVFGNQQEELRLTQDLAIATETLNLTKLQSIELQSIGATATEQRIISIDEEITRLHGLRAAEEQRWAGMMALPNADQDALSLQRDEALGGIDINLQSQHGLRGVAVTQHETAQRLSQFSRGQSAVKNQLQNNIDSIRSGFSSGGRALSPEQSFQMKLQELDATTASDMELLNNEFNAIDTSPTRRKDIEQERINRVNKNIRDRRALERGRTAQRTSAADTLELRQAQFSGQQDLDQAGRGFTFTQLGAEERDIRGQAQLDTSIANLRLRQAAGDPDKQADIQQELTEIQARELNDLDRLYDQTYRNISQNVVGFINNIINSVRSMFKEQRDARNDFTKNIEEMNVDLSNNIRDIYSDESLSYQDKEVKKLEILREFNDRREEEEKEHAETMKKIQEAMLDSFKEKIIQNLSETAMLKGGEFLATQLPKGSQVGSWIRGITGGSQAINIAKQLANTTGEGEASDTPQKVMEAVKETILSSSPPSSPSSLSPDLSQDPTSGNQISSTSSALTGITLSPSVKSALATTGAGIAGGAAGYGLSRLGDEDSFTLNVLKSFGGTALALAGGAAALSGGLAPISGAMISGGLSLAGGGISNLMSQNMYDSPTNDIILQSMAKQAGQTQRSAEDMSRLVVQGFQEGYADQAESAGETSVNVSGHFELGHRELQFIADETSIMRKRGLIG